MKKGGWVRFNDKITYIPDREKKCLTEDQARHIYKMVEMDKPVNIQTMKQEIEDNRMTRNRQKREVDESQLNPYQMAILNKNSRDDAKTDDIPLQKQLCPKNSNTRITYVSIYLLYNAFLI